MMNIHNEHDEAISMACKKFDEIHSNNDEPKWLKYCRLFVSKGGLSDFIIYDVDVQVRNQLNEKYNDEVKKIWRIMKDYI